MGHTSRPLTEETMVEKIAMDELEERKTGRGSVGLVRERVHTCQANETNGKGKEEAGKGEHEGNEDSEEKEKMEAKEDHRRSGRRNR